MTSSSASFPTPEGFPLTPIATYPSISCLMSQTMPSTSDKLGNRRRILVTGGAGFIGGAVVRRLLGDSDATVFNLDKMGYASDLTSIQEVLAELGEADGVRHRLQRVDLKDAQAVDAAVREADPDLVMHLAAESHVDRSISGPGEFISSNVTGTYNLLQAVRKHYEDLSGARAEAFRLHHISTDEVFDPSALKGAFLRQPHTTQGALTQQVKQPATTWCRPGITPSVCRWC